MKLSGWAGRVIAAAAACAALAGCLEGGSEEEDRARLARLRTEIETLVGTAACDDGSQCRYLAFGSKPCGGPWRYLIYSAATTDTAALRKRVTAYNAYEAELNRKWGWMSDCSVPAVPRVGCLEGVCADLDAKR